MGSYTCSYGRRSTSIRQTTNGTFVSAFRDGIALKSFQSRQPEPLKFLLPPGCLKPVTFLLKRNTTSSGLLPHYTLEEPTQCVLILSAGKNKDD